jgi:hypothetical protein
MSSPVPKRARLDTSDEDPSYVSVMETCRRHIRGATRDWNAHIAATRRRSEWRYDMAIFHTRRPAWENGQDLEKLSRDLPTRVTQLLNWHETLSPKIITTTAEIARIVLYYPQRFTIEQLDNFYFNMTHVIVLRQLVMDVLEADRTIEPMEAARTETFAKLSKSYRDVENKCHEANWVIDETLEGLIDGLLDEMEKAGFVAV